MTYDKPTGLLGRVGRNLFGRPGSGEALGLLGAYLMAAGGPSTDPSASGRMLAQGMSQYADALRQGRRDAFEMEEYQRKRSLEDEERRRKRTQAEAMRKALLGERGGGPQEPSLVNTPGAINLVPETARPFLQGLAQADPRQALISGLQLANQGAKPPTTRTRIEGGEEVMEQFDPSTGQFMEIGRGPRWQPRQPRQPSAMDQKINAMVMQGIDRDTATKIATGVYVTSRHPYTGEVTVVDKSTGLPAGQPAQEIQPETAEPQRPVAVPENVDISRGTGPRAFVEDVANTISDAVGQGLQYPETNEAVNALNNLKVRTITAMQSAVPGRPSNYLMEQLNEFAVKPAQILQGDEGARNRLEQTKAMLESEISRIDYDILANPRLFNRKDLAEARISRSELDGLLREYDQILKQFGPQGGDEAGPVPEGIDPEDWQYMTPEERALWQ